MINANAHPPHTAIQCLAAIAHFRGVNVDPERLVVDYESATGEMSPAELLRMASAIGMQSRLTLLSWEDLLGQGDRFPLLARTTDGHWVIVVGVAGGPDRQVAVADPLADATSVALLDRERFCSRWQGDAVFIGGRGEATPGGN